MKWRRFPVAAAAQRRNADLFYAELMGPQSVPPAGASQARLEADRFLADLLGEPAHPRGSGHTLARRLPEPQGFLRPGQMLALSEEKWGESGSCPDRDEVMATWETLSKLRKLLAADQKEMESNPLLIEVQMLRQLMDVLDMAKEVPAKVWDHIWRELKAFASCDVKPLVARVKAGEKHANAVLRVLHGLTSILQGYVHDRIDAGFKSTLEAQKGWGKAVAKLLIHVIKKQIPVIQREIKAQNFAVVATAFQDLKTQLGGQGVSVTGVWDVLVALGKEIIGNAIDDAVKGTARWAAKKVGKKLLGSAAAAASVIFILEDIAHFVHALVTISNYKERLWAFNRLLLIFLARVRPCVAARPGGKYTSQVGWKGTIARADCKFVIRSFIPVKGGKPGEGQWKEASVKGTLNGKTSDIVRIDVPPAEAGPGLRVLGFQMPPVADWPAKDDSFVALDVTTYNSAGRLLKETSLFVSACMP
jgi:hypothetical protein